MASHLKVFHGFCAIQEAVMVSFLKKKKKKKMAVSLDLLPVFLNLFPATTGIVP
jgi:hypothetical protein